MSSAGKICTQRGGFLQGVDLFDAEFFGLSNREAMAMDPQQRLLLEATWQALEDAGADIEALSGTSTGVFCGVSHSDYRMIQCGRPTHR